VVLRGWRAVLDRAARVVVADEVVQEAVVTARSRLLLPLDDAERRAPERLAALAAWGFAQEVVALGERPTWRGLPTGGSWADLGSPDDPAFLGRLRALLVDDAALVDEPGRRGGLILLPGFPPDWAGQPIEVHDLPTPAGRLSFAVRWHGRRPALLWDVSPAPALPSTIGSGHDGSDERSSAVPAAPAVPAIEPPADLLLRAPALDPAWVGHGPAGEALLAPTPASSDRDDAVAGRSGPRPAAGDG
jgi:hypothetical protein